MRACQDTAHRYLSEAASGGKCRECRKYNIVPFIIDENLKMFYYRGLKEWKQEKEYLIDTCLAAQDQFKVYLDYFRIEYDK